MIDNLELGRYTETFGREKPPSIEQFNTETGMRIHFGESSIFNAGMLEGDFNPEHLKEYAFSEEVEDWEEFSNRKKIEESKQKKIKEV